MENKFIDSANGSNEDVVMSRFAWESYNASHERTVKRLVTALLISIALMFLGNVAWLWLFNQFDYESDQVTLNSQEEGNASYMGGNGVIDNGRGESKDD